MRDRLISAPAQQAQPAAEEATEDCPPKQTSEQLEIERLREENEAYRSALETQRKEWDAAIAAAEMRAKSQAAQEHRRDDVNRIALLTQALSQAQSSFEAALQGQAQGLASELAQAALSRLVEPQMHENEWLARSVASRCNQLGDQIVIALMVAPDFQLELPGELQDRLPAGTRIEIDASLASGSARIVLQLGQVRIDPAQGLSALQAAISGLSCDD